MTQATEFLQYDRTMGMTVMEGKGFYYPVDTAIGPDDRMYVISRSREESTRGLRVTICDADGGYFGNFGGQGYDAGLFIWPAGAAVDSQGRCFISDEKLNRVTAYDHDGAYLFHWGQPGSGDGQLDTPSGLAFDSQDHIYVADTYNHRVQKFTADGRFLSALGTAGPGKLNLPWGLTVGPDSNLYVADWGNDCVKKFSPDGDHLAAFGVAWRGRRPVPAALVRRRRSRRLHLRRRLGQRAGAGPRCRRPIRRQATRPSHPLPLGRKLPQHQHRRSRRPRHRQPRHGHRLRSRRPPRSLIPHRKAVLVPRIS